MSAAYRSLHINTSRERMEYPGFPMPKSYPDFPHHTHIARVLRRLRRPLRLPRPDHVRHRGRARRARPDGGWQVTLDTGETRGYDALMVANGHHWDAALAGARVPRRGRRSRACRCTRTTTSATTRSCSATSRSSCWGWATRRWTSRSRPRSAPRATYLAARRGAYVIPKYLFGRPMDQYAASPRIPFAVRRRIVDAMLQGRRRRHGALRAAEARPPLRRGAPDGLRRRALAHRARRDPAAAEHRAADRARPSCSPTAARSRPTSSSTARATRSRSRSSTRT